MTSTSNAAAMPAIEPLTRSRPACGQPSSGEAIDLEV